MTLCTSIDTLSMTYLDDELADEELREFELHLLDCAACRGRVESERELIADLRKRLAPPPTPDIVRARLRAALDVEDAETARAEGRGRFGAWILPGVASVAAVAALAMFVLMREPAERPPSASAVVSGQQMRAPMSPQLVIDGPRDAIVVQRDAMWDEVIKNRDVTKILYSVRLPSDVRLSVLASVFSARDWDIRLGQHALVNGFDLWGTTQNGQAQVFYEGPTGTGYAFAAPELSLRDLEMLVANSLIDDVGGR